MSQPITIAESSRLLALEQKIQSGLQTFVEVGEALMEIRDSRLYRVEHQTFEDYCKSKWNMTRMYASNLIRSSEAARNVNNCLQTEVTPRRESQARPLTKLPAEQQPVAWEKAVEKANGEQPTAKQVEEVVVEIMEPEQPRASTVSMPIKYTPAVGEMTADNALRILGTITKGDTQRGNALLKVAAWCASEIIGDADSQERAQTKTCLLVYLNTLRNGKLPAAKPKKRK